MDKTVIYFYMYYLHNNLDQLLNLSSFTGKYNTYYHLKKQQQKIYSFRFTDNVVLNEAKLNCILPIFIFSFL